MDSQGGLTAEVGSRCTLSHPSVHFAVIGITYICSCVFVILGTLTHCFGVLKRMCQKRAKCCPKICLKLHKKGGTIGTLTAGTKRRCASWFNVVSTCTYCAPYSWPSSVSHRCRFCVKNSNSTKKERALVRKRRSAGTSVYKLVMCISQQRSQICYQLAEYTPSIGVALFLLNSLQVLAALKG